MKITIIGAGNMGGAIARGLLKSGRFATDSIVVSDPNADRLAQLKQSAPSLVVTQENEEAVLGAEIVILAVKPWHLHTVLHELPLKSKQILVSIASGVTFEQLAHELIEPEMPLFRVIPNTAISELESMTLIASRHVTPEMESLLLNLFSQMGLAMVIPEEQLEAATALSSCGIAYLFKYMQAALQAGVEMGLRPDDALKMIAQSASGAARLMLNNNTHPTLEIDKVTTPGGITIKGLNELEHAGFTSAIIKALKASR